MPTRTRQKPSLTPSFSSAELQRPQNKLTLSTRKLHHLAGDIAFIQNEFHKLLRKSRFVARVIEIHLNNETRLSNQTSSSTDSHRDCRAEERNGAEWQELIERNLPHRKESRSEQFDLNETLTIAQQTGTGHTSNMPKISLIFVLAEHQLCVVVTGTGIIFVVNNLWIGRT
jgi:hypothetical protein